MTPLISALLPTYNRAYLLPHVLQGLLEQTLGRDHFEVIVVDDGSSDETLQVLDAWKTRLPLRTARKHHSGIAAAKNLALFLARAPLVVFLDDDDVAQPDLLSIHVEAHRRNPDINLAVLGRTTLDPAIACLPLMHHVTEVGCELFSYSSFRQEDVYDYRAFWGGRSSCKRAFLVRHGVFNPNFRFGCEDIELGWRLRRFGLRVIYRPDAVSVMIRALTFPQFCSRSYRQGRSQRYFASVHAEPEIQQYCEIQRAAHLWHADRVDFMAIHRWTGTLDRLAEGRLALGLSRSKILEDTLAQAYRRCFALHRAKGVMDAAGIAARENTAIGPEGSMPRGS